MLHVLKNWIKTGHTKKKKIGTISYQAGSPVSVLALRYEDREVIFQFKTHFSLMYRQIHFHLYI